MKNIVIFASGSGSNAENIIKYFKNYPDICVSALFSNKADSGAMARAEKLGIPAVAFTRDQLISGEVLPLLKNHAPDLIILAGFLLKFPDHLVGAFRHKIINIHPALLPKYGGKGMYGMNVHRAVAENRELSTGITIHYVDEHYDEGDVIFQASCELSGDETCEEISKKVRKLEHEHFPKVIEKLLRQ